MSHIYRPLFRPILKLICRQSLRTTLFLLLLHLQLNRHYRSLTGSEYCALYGKALSATKGINMVIEKMADENESY